MNGSCGTLGNMTTHRNELLWGDDSEKLFPAALLISQNTVGPWPLYEPPRCKRVESRAVLSTSDLIRILAIKGSIQMCPGLLSLSALLRGHCLFGIELRIHISLRKRCELYGVR